jgi:DNA segregation ATPase FtsK/SpoIIIE-like protein
MGFLLGLVIGVLLGLAVVVLIRRVRDSSHARTTRGMGVSLESPRIDSSSERSPSGAVLVPALENLLRHASTPPNDNRDPEELLANGLRAFTETGGVSTLVLQRRLQLDFAQATILIEEMERRGYVSAKHDQRQRKLLPSAYEFVRGTEP